MEYRFSDIVEINPKETIKKGTLARKISMQDILENNRNIQNFTFERYSGGSKFRNGDTLFARITPCLENGKIAQVNILDNDEVSFGSTEFIVFREKKGLTISDYIYHLSKWEYVRESAIKSMTGTSGRQRVQNSVFDDLIIDLPLIEEQEKIVQILNSLDQKIETNNKIIANLEEQAQAIFKSWFVDFEPFQDGEFVESQLGMIPEGWEVKSLYSIANYKNGLAMQKYRPQEGEASLPVLKIKELRANRTDNNSDRCALYIPKDVKVSDGDVIFSWSGSLLVELWTGGEAGLNQHLFKVTSDIFEKWFYYSWIKYLLNIFISIARDKATTMGHIKISHLKDEKILVPDKKSLSFMNETMKPIINLSINLGIENQKLAETRDTLLPKLMSGEIDVSGIKIDEEEDSHD